MTTFDAFLSCKSVSTDTRNIIPGSVFFALKGARFNGNEFAAEALQQGASFAVVDEPVGEDPRFIYVENVLAALQDCARSYRRYLDIPVVGLTGSNGKTTNKELFHAVLGKKFKVHSTPGNFNNHIGVPLTILGIPEGTEMAIIEMGANHLGEIAELCEIAQPTLGLITNIGRDHIGLFGGVGAIIESNLELYNYLRDHNHNVFVHKESNMLMKYAKGIKSSNKSVINNMLELATKAKSCGLKVNAGHDLCLDNLEYLRKMDIIDEVSIGHSIIVDALNYGFDDTIKRYIEIIKG